MPTTKSVKQFKNTSKTTKSTSKKTNPKLIPKSVKQSKNTSKSTNPKPTSKSVRKGGNDDGDDDGDVDGDVVPLFLKKTGNVNQQQVSTEIHSAINKVDKRVSSDEQMPPISATSENLILNGHFGKLLFNRFTNMIKLNENKIKTLKDTASNNTQSSEYLEYLKGHNDQLKTARLELYFVYDHSLRPIFENEIKSIIDDYKQKYKELEQKYKELEQKCNTLEKKSNQSMMSRFTNRNRIVKKLN